MAATKASLFRRVRVLPRFDFFDALAERSFWFLIFIGYYREAETKPFS